MKCQDGGEKLEARSEMCDVGSEKCEVRGEKLLDYDYKK